MEVPRYIAGQVGRPPQREISEKSIGLDVAANVLDRFAAERRKWWEDAKDAEATAEAQAATAQLDAALNEWVRVRQDPEQTPIVKPDGTTSHDTMANDYMEFVSKVVPKLREGIHTRDGGLMFGAAAEQLKKHYREQVETRARELQVKYLEKLADEGIQNHLDAGRFDLARETAQINFDKGAISPAKLKSYNERITKEEQMGRVTGLVFEGDYAGARDLVISGELDGLTVQDRISMSRLIDAREDRDDRLADEREAEMHDRQRVFYLDALDAGMLVLEPNVRDAYRNNMLSDDGYLEVMAELRARDRVGMPESVASWDHLVNIVYGDGTEEDKLRRVNELSTNNLTTMEQLRWAKGQIQSADNKRRSADIAINVKLLNSRLGVPPEGAFYEMNDATAKRQVAGAEAQRDLLEALRVDPQLDVRKWVDDNWETYKPAGVDDQVVRPIWYDPESEVSPEKQFRNYKTAEESRGNRITQTEADALRDAADYKSWLATQGK